MKTIKKTFEPNDENPFEVQDSLLGGRLIGVIVIAVIIAIIIGIAKGAVLIADGVIYLAETIVKLF